MSEHPRFLVYTRDEHRRKRLAHHIARLVDGRVVAVLKPEHVDRVAEQYPIAGAVVDINSHDRNVRGIMKAVRAAEWQNDPAIVYLYDDTESTIGFMVEERADWLSRRLSNREIVKRLVASANIPSPLAEEDDDDPSSIEMTFDEVAFDPMEDGLEFSSSLGDDARVRLSEVLDDIESQIESNESLSKIASSIERSAALLEGTEVGPETKELLTESLNEPTEQLVREAVQRLRRFANTGSDMPWVLFLSEEDGPVQLAAEHMRDVSITRVVNSVAMMDTCLKRVPDAVVLIDSNGALTSRSLQLLRYFQQSNPIPVLIRLVGERSGVGEASDYGVTEIVDPEISVEDFAARVREFAYESMKNRPKALVLDLDGDLMPKIKSWLVTGSLTPMTVQRLPDVTDAAADCDIIFMSEKYTKISGLDASRVLSHELRMLRPPIILVTEAERLAELCPRASQLGIDELLSSDMPADQASRRSWMLIENYRLRMRAAEMDRVTGVMHACALSRRLTARLSEASDSLSLLMVDVDNFRGIRKSYGDAAARKVLRTLADHLAEKFGTQQVYRDWTDRFFILPKRRIRGEREMRAVADTLKSFNKITFRSDDGRGFYATLTSAHLLVPQGVSNAQSVLNKLTRILTRAKNAQRGEMMSAAMDPASIGGLHRDAAEPENKRPRWDPVVLTWKDD